MKLITLFTNSLDEQSALFDVLRCNIICLDRGCIAWHGGKRILGSIVIWSDMSLSYKTIALIDYLHVHCTYCFIDNSENKSYIRWCINLILH